ncbi:MAG: DNA polymerase III subunit chi, partial [Gammaproteobacteria bacterium]|nr:DNA polymerase III subunit chi [Gammaproteobacteria bacterium]
MTRIDFYIIEQGDSKATDTFICRLAEKAWLQDNTVYLHATDEQHVMKYDELLWTFSEKSFVPHQQLQNAIPSSTIKNILIG